MAAVIFASADLGQSVSGNHIWGVMSVKYVMRRGIPQFIGESVRHCMALAPCETVLHGGLGGSPHSRLRGLWCVTVRFVTSQSSGGALHWNEADDEKGGYLI